MKAAMPNQQQTNMIRFKSVTKEDLPLLYTWFKEPHVYKWWPTLEANEFFEHFLRRIRSKDTFAYIVFADEKAIGYIQYYYIDRASKKSGAWLPELPKTTVGTDQFIGDPNYLGKGYGTLFIKEFIKYLSNTLEPDITTIIVDPDPNNYVAIKCYEKVGFTSIGIYAVHEEQHLLMRYDVPDKAS